MHTHIVLRLLCRAPDNPHQQIVKRLLAVEGDVLLEDPGITNSAVDVPQVFEQHLGFCPLKLHFLAECLISQASAGNVAVLINP
jgi:hypothetical protein